MRPLVSCLLKGGVAHRVGFDSLFFAFGFDEFMAAIRAFMRNHQVDSTMAGPVVESGSTVLVMNDLPLTLVVAPSYVEMDSLAEDRSYSRSFSTASRAPASPAAASISTRVAGPRPIHRLPRVQQRREIQHTIALLLRRRGARHVSRCGSCGRRRARGHVQDQAQIWGQSASRRVQRPPHLARWSGRVYGSAAAHLCPSAELERDLAWLSEQAEKQAAEVAEKQGPRWLCYSHASDSLPSTPLQERGTGKRTQSIKRWQPPCPRSPSPNTAHALLHRHAPQLPCPIDELLVATVAGCAGEASPVHLAAAVQGRTLLAMRYEGTLTGAERHLLPSTSAPWQPSRASSSR
jgi:hypothetical protein